jgi:3-oxoacyl-[acyl-carrier protein] reductase
VIDVSANGTTEAIQIADIDKIQSGDKKHLSKVITEADLEAFAELSGDYNPLHMNDVFAKKTSFQRRVAHGMLVASYVSTLVGMQLPGPGALWTAQSYRWLAPVFIGDTVELMLTVLQVSRGSRTLRVGLKAVNQNGNIVMDGEGSILLVETKPMQMDLGLSERVALVTGSSRGIGAATAAALARGGARVVITYLKSATAAEEICHSIEKSGGQAIAAQLDVAEMGLVDKVVGRARDHFSKPVDVLVNNAGSEYSRRSFMETEWSEIEAQLQVHLRGAFNCCKAVVPGMLELKSGRIVNIGSSLTGGRPPAQWMGLILAKSALGALTRCLATELGPGGIRVNTVSPGMIETESIANIPERARKLEAMQTPLRRLGFAEDIANAVVALCGDAGAYVTGIEMPICGGSSM